MALMARDGQHLVVLDSLPQAFSWQKDYSTLRMPLLVSDLLQACYSQVMFSFQVCLKSNWLISASPFGGNYMKRPGAVDNPI